MFNYLDFYSQPTEISRRIIDFVQGISRGNYEDIVGTYDNFDHIIWMCGDITIKGKVYVNCGIRYTISTNVWTIYSYAQNVTAAILYDDGVNILQVGGSSEGAIVEIDSGTTDIGIDIQCQILSRWYTINSFAARLSQITGAAAIQQNCGGMKVQFQYDKDNEKFSDVMALTNKYADIFPNLETPDFNRFRYMFSGSYNKTVPVFETIELLTVVDKGYVNN